MAAKHIFPLFTFVLLIFLSFNPLSDSVDFLDYFPNFTEQSIFSPSRNDPPEMFEHGPTPIIRYRTPNSSLQNQIQLDTFAGISRLLKSSGYTEMASFLDTQLEPGLSKEKKITLTIFAPLDRFWIETFSDFWPVHFRAHIIPNRLPWKDLVKLSNGTELPRTFAGHGYKIRVTRRSLERGRVVLEVNGVRVIAPDMYYGESFVVHGVGNSVVSVPPEQASRLLVQNLFTYLLPVIVYPLGLLAVYRIYRHN